MLTPETGPGGCIGLFSGDVTQAIGAAEAPKDEAISNLYINLLAMPG